MYLGQQAPMQAGGMANTIGPLNPPPTKPTFHGGARTICERLAGLASNYEVLIQRLNGPRPSNAIQGDGKEQREPATFEFMEIAHKLLTELESQYQELASSIG